MWLSKLSPSEAERPAGAPREDTVTTPNPTSVAPPQRNPPSTTQSREERTKEAVEVIERALATPITFSGKVVDQNGEHVGNAKVEFSMLDSFNSSGSNRETFADDNGYFIISEVKGAVLGVNVSKRGYYQIHNVSNQRFAYGVGPDGYTKPPPTKDNPAVFVLHKMGKTRPLIRVSSRQIDLPRNGSPLIVDLASGRTGRGDLQVSSQIGDTSHQPFDWRYQLVVPSGGLVERRGQFEFEAPADGYRSSVEVRMAANVERWTSRLTKEYFAKLSDGRYARFSIRFYAGDRNFVVLESYVNPEPESRNLEFDPAKVVKSP